MLNFPIGLRTRNRPVYLDTTIKSIMATKLPEDPEVIILDDCSDDDITKKYLFTDEVIPLPEPHKWPLESKVWKSHVGPEWPDITELKGIASKFEVIQPEKKRGVRGGVFWCVDTLMKKYPDSPAVILIEADAVFNENWYEATLLAYEACKDTPGPNGKTLGLLTAYDRKPKGGSKGTEMGWGFRSVKKLSNGNWGCGNGIGGVMYLVTRDFYNSSLKQFQGRYSPTQRAGDTAIQALCGIKEFSIARTKPSFIQHIGAKSLAWPTKGWRHCRNFRRPPVLLDDLEGIG